MPKLTGILTIVFSRFAFVAAVFSIPFVALANSGITYQGRILKPDGSPLEGSNVQFKMQIRTPGPESCVLYEEQQSLDLRNTRGLFSLTLNDGSGSRLDSSGYSIDRIFANRGTFAFGSGACAIGTLYAPNSSDGRRMVVRFKDETMSSWEPMPPTNINFVPFAFEAKQVQGFSAESLVRVQEADGTMGNIAPLSNANYLDLLNLVGGTSPNYVRASNGAGARVPVVTGNPLSPVAGSVWFDSVSGKLKFHDGSSAVDVGGGGGGGVTSVTAGSGLVTSPGAGITATGSIAIAVGGVVTNMLADGSVTTIKIGDSQVTDVKLAANSVIEAKIANGAVTSAKILDGTIAGVDLAPDIVISTTGSVTASGFTTTGNITVGGDVVVTGGVSATTVTSGISTTRQLQLFDPDPGSVNKITFTADAALNADYTLKWPLTAGSANQVLSTDGLGNLSWVNASSGADNLGNHTATQNIQLGNYWLSGDGGNEGLRVDANGNVGIGTATPGSKLHLHHGASNELAMRVSYPSLSDGDWTGIGLGQDSRPKAGILFEKAAGVGSGRGNLHFAVDDTADSSAVNLADAKMTILRGGNVGIGTTTPTQALDVSGNTKSGGFMASQGTVANPSYRFINDATSGTYLPAAFNLGFVTNGSERVRIDGTGNVGIGTTTPGASLDIQKSTNQPAGLIGTSTFLTKTGGAGSLTGSSIALEAANSSGGDLLGMSVGVAHAGGSISDVTAASIGTYILGGDVFSLHGMHILTDSSGGHVTGDVYGIFIDQQGTADGTVFGIYQSAANAKNFFAGAVGIGTEVPLQMLDVGGAIRIGNSTTCGAPTAGSIRYNGGNLQLCNGTSWQTLSAGGSDSFAALPCGDGFIPYKASGAWGCREVASINSNNTVITRDISGNFASNSATLNSLSLNNAGSIVQIQNPLGAAYTLTLPPTAGSANQVLQTNGVGVLSWVNQSVGGGGDFKADGSVPMAGTLKMAGNTIYGHSTSSGMLTLESTSNATKGHVVINPNGGNVGIGTTSPASALDIVGSANVSGGFKIGDANAISFPNVAIDNIAIGNTALGVTTSTNGASTAVGYQSLSIATTGYRNTALGAYSGKSIVSGQKNVLIGMNTMRNGTGVASSNVAVGDSAMSGYVGTDSGSYNVAVGESALKQPQTATNNVAVGYHSMVAITTGDYNTSLGNQAGDTITTGIGNVLLGNGANPPTAATSYFLNIAGTIFATGANGSVSAPAGNVGIGTTTPAVKLDVAGTMKIGSGGELCPAVGAGGIRYNAGAIEFCDGASWAALSGGGGASGWTDGGVNVTLTTATDNVGIGGTPNYKLDVTGDINTSAVLRVGGLPTIKRMTGPFAGAQSNLFIGTGENHSSLVTATADRNVAVGTEAGRVLTTGVKNVFLGHAAGNSLTSGGGNTFVGNFAAYTATIGDSNTSMGDEASNVLTSGSRNTSLGSRAGGNAATGDENVFIGTGTGGNGSNVGDMDNNVVIGGWAGSLLRGGTSGNGANNNILVGWSAGDNITTGDNNIIIGHNIDSVSATGSNFMSIGNIIYATGVNGTGTTVSTANVGIGTTSPSGNLQVVGAGDNLVNIGPSTATNGNAYLYLNGKQAGATKTAGFWASYDGTLNFTHAAGSGGYVFTDAATSSTLLKVTTAGNVGIGTASPSEKLVVNGNVLAAAYLYSSDESLKKDIWPLDHALQNILRIQGVSYDWKNPASVVEERRQIGVIAQDVRKVYPEAVVEDASGKLRVNYPALVAPIIEAIRELFDMNEETKAHVTKLESRVQELEARNKALETRLENFEKLLMERQPAASKR